MSTSEVPFTLYDLRIIGRFPWTKSYIEYQYKMRHLVKEVPIESSLQRLLSVAAFEKNHRIQAGGILYDLESHRYGTVFSCPIRKTRYPYIPSLLSIRNKKPLIEVIKHFEENFDIILIEGAGVQHPRFFGIACEIGVDLNVPTFGVTKNSLYGTIARGQAETTDIKENSNHELCPVRHLNKEIAYFIRKRGFSKGIYVSIGHLVSLSSILTLVQSLLTHRIPEPIRLIKRHLRSSFKENI
ncbi:MAG: endonuclease V [Candidatus Thorarchaeota archaeon]